MKKLLRLLWFPRLRAARAERDRWMVDTSWARAEMRRAHADRNRAVELMANRHARVIALHVEIREKDTEIDSLRRALDALTSTAKKIDAWQVTR